MASESQTINVNAASIGGDGYFTLILSNVLILCTAGISLLWYLKQVVKYATQTPSVTPNCDVLMVLGMRPDNDNPGEDFITRLNRAKTLFEVGSANKILIVGGKTGNNSKTEAQIGMEYLAGAGIPPDFILLEDHSRHTLENLSNARSVYLGKNEKSTSIITSRFHLARSHIMAKGLQLSHTMCGAEERFDTSLRNLLHIFVEAYFIHWYYTGKLWANSIRSEKSLRRIR